ncbi:MerR family transcriptional regulator [Micromonospora cathayae]|uniref:MerR family transcriptional regulator n=1 Tax=Micromonospora cathayae TaxID=3028804 RepID=A0ABY7ZTD9_9ACTN|nr:MerR family transcriptional regulator [Micromonospora sp. HUAS 3]WDZ85199.1 MerR family transcriptional regulator [Micromonospora sp. HUAS 3]
MRIGELAQRTGVSPRALRYYESQGLLRPRRRASGYREYDASALLTVRHIRLLLSAGLGTTAIAEILPCVPDDRTVLAPTCPELLDGLAEERARISAQIERLTAARGILDALIATGADVGAGAGAGADVGARPATATAGEQRNPTS